MDGWDGCGGARLPVSPGAMEPKFISAYQPFLTHTHVHLPGSSGHRPVMSEPTGVSQQPICKTAPPAHRAPGKLARPAGACKLPPGPRLGVKLELRALSWGQSTDLPARTERWADLRAAAEDSSARATCPPKLSPTRLLRCKQPPSVWNPVLSGFPGRMSHVW